MNEFLETLKNADANYWDEFLEKAKELHEDKFTVRKCGFANMSIYQINRGGLMASHKKEALESL